MAAAHIPAPRWNTEPSCISTTRTPTPRHTYGAVAPRRRHDGTRRALRIGLGGPVGSGKTATVAALCRALRDQLSIAVVTNDIYTREDAEFLLRNAMPYCRPSASPPWRPEPARTPRSAMTSRPTWRRSRSSRRPWARSI
ncbi:hypothetical protein GCM10017744_019070 [Streptomyces antimycoticus]